MQAAGATQYTFHLEATSDVEGCIRKIREANMKVREMFSENKRIYNMARCPI